MRVGVTVTDEQYLATAGKNLQSPASQLGFSVDEAGVVLFDLATGRHSQAILAFSVINVNTFKKRR